MDVQWFFRSFLDIINEMSPYLLLGFLIAGILHVFVPRKFYRKYLSKDNKLSVLYAALIGIPLPLCSCGVIPTAIGLKNEKASNGAVASFLIATPQTGIDSILATFSLMGLGFAIIRPTAALVTGVCGGLLINRLLKEKTIEDNTDYSCQIEKGNKIVRVFKYAYIDMIQNIGARLLVGLLLAALINIAIPDEFFLSFGNYPLLQMLVILLIAIPMYICSTGSIPIAAALIMKGLSPGAALVMLMAGPAVNMASILVVKKSLGSKFTWIYVLTIVVGAIIFGYIVNFLNAHTAISFVQNSMSNNCDATCCQNNTNSMGSFSIFKLICSIILIILIINALVMKLFAKFKKTEVAEGTLTYRVNGMHCSHCKAAVEDATMKLKGIKSATADVNAKTLVIEGSVDENKLKTAIEKAGFEFGGRISE